MLVYEYFEKDNNKAIINLQYEMYSYSISTIFEEIKRIYLDNKYSILYLSKDEIEKIRKIDTCDHRLIQNAHDIIAAVFRFQEKNGIFEKELFDKNNNEIKSLFDSIYMDIKFLEKIPCDYWNLAYKWHIYLLDILRKNISLVHELILSTITYSNSPQNELKWIAAERARTLIKEQYDEIPWKIDKVTDNKNNSKKPLSEKEIYKIEYVLYDYSEKCKIGYGGIAYHKGYIIFYNNYLSIEDHETDRDDWDDAWHGSHTKYHIQSESYPELIAMLSKEYQCANLEENNETLKDIYISLNTENEKILFLLLISIIIKKDSIMYGGELARLICRDKIIYHIKKSQYDDFFPDSDSLNYDKTDIVNSV
jgi:hypothetical protein